MSRARICQCKTRREAYTYRDRRAADWAKRGFALSVERVEMREWRGGPVVVRWVLWATTIEGGR